ncbi:MAG: hypothetical protein JWO57_2711 [Pseudonocardiales bacterium]|nr:hypothetical protein [Pseudonocardiales bacterium]
MSQPTSLPTIAVHGTALRSVAPDSFLIVARVIVEASQSGAAADALVQRYAALEAALAALDLDVDIQRGPVTSYEDVSPDAGRGPMWRAMRDMTLTGRDTSQAAALAGALGRVPDTAIEGPHWQIEGDNPAHHEIQADAVREALARAERYAAALGGTLGRLVELSDTEVGSGRHMVFAASARAADHGPGLETLDFTPQPIELHASVQARWFLTPLD